MRPTTVTPTPEALKALTHPVRLRMLGLLRVEGPATATSLAARLGVNTGTTSYHLRQLARHGFVADDADRGNGRERWWRAAHQATVTDTRAPEDPQDRQDLEAYLQSVVVVMGQTMQRSVEQMPLLSQEWSDASTYSDFVVRLTPSRARALLERLAAELLAVEDDDDEVAEAFLVQLSGFRYPAMEPR